MISPHDTAFLEWYVKQTPDKVLKILYCEYVESVEGEEKKNVFAPHKVTLLCYSSQFYILSVVVIVQEEFVIHLTHNLQFLADELQLAVPAVVLDGRDES